MENKKKPFVENETLHLPDECRVEGKTLYIPDGCHIEGETLHLNAEKTANDEYKCSKLKRTRKLKKYSLKHRKRRSGGHLGGAGNKLEE